MNGTPWDTPRAAELSESERRLFAALLTIGFAATVAATVVGNGNIIAALAPTLTAAALATMWIVPIRLTLFALMFLVLAVDAPGDTSGVWNSPFAWLGKLLTHNLNKTIPMQALVIPLMTVVLLCLLLVHVHRRLTASQTDDRGEVAIAAPMLWALGISALTVFGLCVEGYIMNGSTQMAKIQVQTFVQLLLVAYLLATTLRGARDYRILGRLIVAAACSKALMAVWVYFTVTAELNFRTTHGDSILFACATVILLAVFVEQPTKRNAQLGIAIIPVIFAGMLANNRRLVWVEVSAALIMLAIMTRRTRLKVAVMRVMLLALPIVATYGIVGWNSEGQIFAPVHMFRSVSDAEVDGSTWYRDVENYNLLATLRQSPVTGTGFGLPYLTVIPNADITAFKEWLYLPHNSILSLWGIGGFVGFTGLFAVLVVGVYFAARRYFTSGSPIERIAAFTALTCVSTYLIHCWGDLGFSEIRSIFLVGPALAIASQLGRPQGGVAHSSSTTTRELIFPA